MAGPPIISAEASAARRYSGIRSALAAGLAGLAGFTLFWFDPNLNSFYPVCVFHQATGLLCPGCGSLRALHHLLHGHLITAFRFNPLLMITLPIIACYALACLLRRLRGEPAAFGIQSKWLWFFLGAALAFTVGRNLPGAPFSTLPS